MSVLLTTLQTATEAFRPTPRLAWEMGRVLAEDLVDVTRMEHPITILANEFLGLGKILPLGDPAKMDRFFTGMAGRGWDGAYSLPLPNLYTIKSGNNTTAERIRFEIQTRENHAHTFGGRFFAQRVRGSFEIGASLAFYGTADLLFPNEGTFPYTRFPHLKPRTAVGVEFSLKRSFDQRNVFELGLEASLHISEGTSQRATILLEGFVSAARDHQIPMSVEKAFYQGNTSLSADHNAPKDFDPKVISGAAGFLNSTLEALRPHAPSGCLVF